jgi:hypothetical protein
MHGARADADLLKNLKKNQGFPEEHEAFTKFCFQFCSPKCLTAGRKATNNWADIAK